MDNTIIEVKHVKTLLGGAWIHKDVTFSLARGKVSAIVGGSGCGKSVLLREMLGLMQPARGVIELFGENIAQLSQKAWHTLRQRCGILFQEGALFSSLTVLENLIFPLQQFTALNQDTCRELAMFKLALVGLTPDTAIKYPSELSGGMQKRAALARALMMDPELLFLDEPGAGLDPVSAAAQDDLLVQLQKSLQLTVVLVTHDVTTLANIVEHIVFLGEGKVLAAGNFQELQQHTHPLVHAYFHNIRAMGASAIYARQQSDWEGEGPSA